MNLRGALDNAQYHQMRGVHYLALRCSRETQKRSSLNSQSYKSKFNQSTMN
jgi:hypothetical protein